MRLDVEEKKIEAKVEMEELRGWNSQVEAKLSEAVVDMKQLREWLEQRKRNQEIKLHETRMQFLAELNALKKDDASSKAGQLLDTTMLNSRMANYRSLLPQNSVVVTKIGRDFEVN